MTLKRKIPLPVRKKPIQRRVAAKGNKRSGSKHYCAVRNEFLNNNPVCLTQILGEADPEKYTVLLNICEKKAVTIQHASKNRRAGSALTDSEHFKGLCAMCHQYIDTHSGMARALGYKS